MSAFAEAIAALEEKRAKLEIVVNEAAAKLERAQSDHHKAITHCNAANEKLASVKMALAVLQEQHP